MRFSAVMAQTVVATFSLFSVAHADNIEWLGASDNWSIGWNKETDSPFCEVDWSAGERLVTFAVFPGHNVQLGFRKTSWKLPAGAETTVSTYGVPPLQVRAASDQVLLVHDAPQGVVGSLLNTLTLTGYSFEFKGNEGQWWLPKLTGIGVETGLKECARRLDTLPTGPTNSQPL